ncbi:hypothetical protein ACP70R_030963 [Stipagrostis hirtigluma subsp. patula]
MARLGVAAVLAVLLVAAAFGSSLDLVAAASPLCSGAVGECGVGDDEEMAVGGDGIGEALHRVLAARQPANKFVSYGALKEDQVRCSQRGNTSASCAALQPANPYRRGCSETTRCKRNMD